MNMAYVGEKIPSIFLNIRPICDQSMTNLKDKNQNWDKLIIK